MSISDIFKNYGWVGLGSLGGLCVGGISNFSQTKSIFKQPQKTAEYYNTEHRRHHQINTFREQAIYGGLTPGFNAMALVPVTTFVAWNIFTGGTNNLIHRISSEVYSHIVYPLIPTISSLLLGRGLRSIWERKVPKSERLDISGHAIIQTASAILIKINYCLLSPMPHPRTVYLQRNNNLHVC